MAIRSNTIPFHTFTPQCIIGTLPSELMPGRETGQKRWASGSPPLPPGKSVWMGVALLQIYISKRRPGEAAGSIEERTSTAHAHCMVRKPFPSLAKAHSKPIQLQKKACVSYRTGPGHGACTRHWAAAHHVQEGSPAVGHFSKENEALPQSLPCCPPNRRSRHLPGALFGQTSPFVTSKKDRDSGIPDGVTICQCHNVPIHVPKGSNPIALARSEVFGSMVTGIGQGMGEPSWPRG